MRGVRGQFFVLGSWFFVRGSLFVVRAFVVPTRQDERGTVLFFVCRFNLGAALSTSNLERRTRNYEQSSQQFLRYGSMRTPPGWSTN